MRASILLLLALCGTALPGPLSRSADETGAAVVARIRPAVVTVVGVGAGERRIPSTGVLLHPGSTVLTWSRIAAPGWRARILLSSGRRVAGEVASRDAETGLTVVKLEERVRGGIRVSMASLTAGEPIFSAGHPYGTDRADGGPAISLGVLAQVRRTAAGSPYRYLISGAVNPGEYGGPLLDRAGRLAGLLLAERDAPSGLSAALPVAEILAELDDSSPIEAALEPPSGSDPVDWPVQDALREAAEGVFPAVPSLIVTPEKEDGESWSSSGVVVSDGGLLVTTASNLSGAGSVVAVFPDGRELPAQIVARDERVGIVLLRVEAEDPPVGAPLAEEPPSVGSFVTAVGNPNGREVRHGPLLTVGIVGAMNRSDRRYGALHTDAAVNRSNAGGALVDLDGRVVGILTTLGGATLEDYGTNSGIGFAIPIDVIREHLPRLAKGETIAYRPGYLGVQLDLDPRPGGGVAIESVVEGQAAAKAGLEAGDVIVGANALPIENFEDLRRIFSNFEIDQSVEIHVERDGESLSFSATLGAWPGGGPR